MTDYALFDKAELLDRVGDDEELVDDLIELYLEDYPSKIEDIKNNLSSGDGAAVSAAAHGIKGSSANLSFNSVAEFAKQIEFAGKENNLDEAAARFIDLEAEIVKLLAVISL